MDGLVSCSNDINTYRCQNVTQAERDHWTSAFRSNSQWKSIVQPYLNYEVSQLQVMEGSLLGVYQEMCHVCLMYASPPQIYCSCCWRQYIIWTLGLTLCGCFYVLVVSGVDMPRCVQDLYCDIRIYILMIKNSALSEYFKREKMLLSLRLRNNHK